MQSVLCILLVSVCLCFIISTLCSHFVAIFVCNVSLFVFCFASFCLYLWLSCHFLDIFELFVLIFHFHWIFLGLFHVHFCVFFNY